MPQVQVQPTEFNYTKKQIVLGLVAAFLIYAVSFYYLQTMGVARPRMAAELNGMPLFSWLISIPGLAGALVTLLFSKFSDIYGRRLMLIVSLSLCLLGTILSAVSPTFVSLIIANTISFSGTRRPDSALPFGAGRYVCSRLNAVSGSGCLTSQPGFFPCAGQRWADGLWII